MADTSNMPIEPIEPVEPIEPDEVTARRRAQDLECLTLLKEAHQLRMQSEFLDGMFAALQGGPMDILPENVESLAEMLKNIDEELDL